MKVYSPFDICYNIRMIDYQALVKRMARARGALTPGQWAEQMQVTPEYAASVEAGETRPSLEYVARAAEAAFGKRAGQVLTGEGGERRLDLHRANELAAQEAGILPENIYRVATCTSCEEGLFESRRRDGDAAGRLMAIAALAAANAEGEEDGI